MSPELAAHREQFYAQAPELEPAPASGGSFETDLVIVLHSSGNGRLTHRHHEVQTRAMLSRRYDRRPAAKLTQGRQSVRAPRSRRTLRARASRGSPGRSTDDPGEPEPPLARRRLCAPSHVVYGRAAALEALAVEYGLAGRDDLHAIGCALSDQLERIADRRRAA